MGPISFIVKIRRILLYDRRLQLLVESEQKTSSIVTVTLVAAVLLLRALPGEVTPHIALVTPVTYRVSVSV